MHAFVRPALAGLLALSGTALAAQRLSALAEVAPGEWRLHEVGARGGDRTICLAEPRLLLQVRHGASACQSFVVEDTAKRATVTYSCPGHGLGRTTVSVEGAGLARVQTQGIADGAPFDLDYEARRVGDCPTLARR